MKTVKEQEKYIRDNIFVSVLFFLCFILYSCNTEHKSMERTRYDWLPTTCAPTKYPVRILEGFLSLPDEDDVRLPDDAYLGNGWGNTGSVLLIGDKLKSLPDSLSITWFAFRERKFYQGKFGLSALRLEEYFREGFISPINGQHTTYSYVLFGMAPGGGISVWLSGDAITKEVGFLKAGEAKVNMEDFLGAAPNLDAYVKISTTGSLSPEEMTPIATTLADAAKWSGIYRSAYKWHPNIVMTAPATAIGINYFNGERLYWKDLKSLSGYAGQPIPKQCSIYWNDKQGKETISEVTFDEDEIFAAYKRMDSLVPGNQIVLEAEINQLTFAAKVYLHDNSHVIDFKKCSYKTY